MDIENLQSSNNRSTESRPPDGFHTFLHTAFSAILAFVLSLRVIVFATARKRLTNTAANPDIQVEEASSSSSDTSSDTEVVEEGVFVQIQGEPTMSERKPTAPGMPSVMSLLQTDEILSSCSDDEPIEAVGLRTTSGLIPLPSLIQSNMSVLPNFLHTINEEESDEVRSLTGSSLASPRTVVDRRLSNISLLSPTPDEDFEEPQEQQQQEDEVRGSESRNSLGEERIVVGEPRTTRQIEITQSASEDDRLDLLKELAKIGKSNSGQMNTTTVDKQEEEIIDATGPGETTVEKKETVVVTETKPEGDVEEPDYALVPAESEDDTAAAVETVQNEIAEVMEVLEAPQKAELVTIPMTHSEPEDHKLSLFTISLQNVPCDFL
ncbi:hypothetical protein B9Z55_025127 [Caenorhabditis nigoni]|uniref:Uncharacterized protein n=1 Tax=Caenorhabditis nigoni TaxID=1611254 RepID=A0A2G5SX75_9PELO|nr:hypothetical protein B9Z55_025127 [Caenorhabditis nigoni]